MTPYSVHLLAQIIRHQRGMATALEKWILSPGFSQAEAVKLVGVLRGVLDSYEAQLSAAETEQ